MKDAKLAPSPARVKKKTISIPPELLEGALRQSKFEERTLSSYVRSLIAKDLARVINQPATAA